MSDLIMYQTEARRLGSLPAREGEMAGGGGENTQLT